MNPRSWSYYLITPLLLLALVVAATTDAKESGAVQPRQEEKATLDPTRPVPRELILETLREMFALPPEDHLHWDEAVAEGRIPHNVEILKNHLMNSPRPNPEKLGPPPSMTLPGGEEFFGIYVELLGPNLGANVTQEDLNSLIPAMAEGQKRLHSRAVAGFKKNHPMIQVQLEPEDFVIAAIRPASSPDGETMTMTLRRAEFSQEVYVEKTPLVDGRHVHGIRKVATDDRERWHLRLNFTDEGARLFAQATRDAKGGQLALIVEGKLVSAPRAEREITGGSAEITCLNHEEIDSLLEKWALRTEPVAQP